MGASPGAGGVRWTPEQRLAIGVRHDEMLVAAAAGSGKTAVLIERIVRLVAGDDAGPGGAGEAAGSGGQETFGEAGAEAPGGLMAAAASGSPGGSGPFGEAGATASGVAGAAASGELGTTASGKAGAAASGEIGAKAPMPDKAGFGRRTSLDRLLVLTFTRAAAEEMRSRLARALLERARTRPGDPHLRRQLLLLPQAEVTTFDAYALRVVRRFAHLIGWDPSFRLIDEIEERPLRQAAVEATLAWAYGTKAPDDPFYRLVDWLHATRDDGPLVEALFRLDDFVRSLPDPDAFFAAGLEAYAGAAAGATAGRWFLAFRRTMTEALEGLVRDLRGLVGQARAVSAKAAEPFAEDAAAAEAALEAVRAAEGWDDVVAALRGFFARPLARVSVRGLSPEAGAAVERLKRERAALRDQLKDRLTPALVPAEEAAEEAAAARPVLEALVGLYREYADRLEAIKGRENVRTFSDVARALLRVLEAGALEAVAAQYDEVLVDEYQDTNRLQDAFVARLSARGVRVFMVGDVKQSIYRFRLSEPRLFQEKYERFRPIAAPPAEGPADGGAAAVGPADGAVAASSTEGAPDGEGAALSAADAPGGGATALSAEGAPAGGSWALSSEGPADGGGAAASAAGPAPEAAAAVGAARDAAAGSGEAKSRVRIDLNRNFRSKPEILRFINALFERLMVKEAAEIDYDAAAALRPGKEVPPDPEAVPEWTILDVRPGAAEPPSAAADGEGGEATGAGAGGGSAGAPDGGAGPESAGAPAGPAPEADGAFGEEAAPEEEEEAPEGAEAEGRWIARRIRELVAAGRSYREIAVLLPTMRGAGDVYARALREAGIPAVVDQRSGLFEAIDLKRIVALLQLLDNGAQDIPLAAVLTAPFGGFTDAELAEIRAAYPDRPFHRAVRALVRLAALREKETAGEAKGAGAEAAGAGAPRAGATGSEAVAADAAGARPDGAAPGAEEAAALPDEAEPDAEAAAGSDAQTPGDGPAVSPALLAKLLRFFRRLQTWRRLSRRLSPEALLDRLYADTGYPAYVLGLPEGELRRERLFALRDLAARYAEHGLGGLSGFLRELERLQESGADDVLRIADGEEDRVRIMTVHRSKGLEFPVVFLAGLGRGQNREDERESLLLHGELGFALRRVDLDLGVERVEAVYRFLLQERLRRERGAEAIRLLYVGLTRAKERLILVSAVRDAAQTFGLRSPKSSRGRLIDLPPRSGIRLSDRPVHRLYFALEAALRERGGVFGGGFREVLDRARKSPDEAILVTLPDGFGRTAAFRLRVVPADALVGAPAEGSGAPGRALVGAKGETPAESPGGTPSEMPGTGDMRPPASGAFDHAVERAVPSGAPGIGVERAMPSGASGPGAAGARDRVPDADRILAEAVAAFRLPDPPALAALFPRPERVAKAGEALLRAMRLPDAGAAYPAKLSVTELKRRLEAPDPLARPLVAPFRLRRPRFSGAALTPEAIGSAVHRVLQSLDFGGPPSIEAVEATIRRLVEGEALLPEEAEAVDRAAIVRFWTSPLGARLARAARTGTLRREVSFLYALSPQALWEERAGTGGADAEGAVFLDKGGAVLSAPAGAVRTAAGPDGEAEPIVVQGTIDALFEEDGGLVLLDYKTDRTDRSAPTGAGDRSARRPPSEEALRKRHALQLRLYARAIEAIWGVPVRERWIVYLDRDEPVRV
ncbi:UvrD-helicase domain-containing protein [Hydrogenibacillus schlegelii]|nr:UvrD-helicase domain-containing protein [Hydrogenibacillus schlegelii]